MPLGAYRRLLEAFKRTLEGKGMRHVFKSYFEFLDAAKAKASEYQNKNGSRHWAAGEYHDGWAGNDAPTMSQAVKFAEEGWAKGRADVMAVVDKLNVAGKVHRTEIRFDVTGDVCDIGRLLEGDPECMMYRENIEEQSESGNIIKIIVNTTFSGGIDESIIRRRGAAILSLIEGLEASGKRVELDMLFAESDKHGEYVRVTVKTTDQPISEDLVAYAVAHPSFSRRFCHLITGRGIMPGNPAGIESECDIYVPMAMLGAKEWESEHACLAWAVKYLAQYGVKIDAN